MILEQLDSVRKAALDIVTVHTIQRMCLVVKLVMDCWNLLHAPFVQAGYSPGTFPGARTGNVSMVSPALASKLLESKGNWWSHFHRGVLFVDQ